MDPMTAAMGINAVGNAAAGAFGGGGQESSLFVVSPMQRLLQHVLQQNALTGNLGDMGGGTAFRQGQANFGQQAADRGISPTSGAYMAGMSNVATDAQAQDTNNLRNYIMQIAGLNQQVASGREWKPSQGISTGPLGAQYAPQGNAATGAWATGKMPGSPGYGQDQGFVPYRQQRT